MLGAETMEDSQERDDAGSRHPEGARRKSPWRAKETLTVVLLVAALFGIGILFGTSRIRAAWEAREEKAVQVQVPAQQVTDLQTSP
jgi:hypothetical protein